MCAYISLFGCPCLCLVCNGVSTLPDSDSYADPTTIYHYSTVSTAHCIHWFDLFAPKTMSTPPYTTIPLCTASTASSGLTFLRQRQCPHRHIPLFHCVLHPLHTLVWPFCNKDNVHTTIYHYSTAYCIHWFDFFAPTPTACTAWPLCGVLTFLHQHLLHTAYLTPYLLHTLCELTFLHQLLLCTAYPTAWGMTFLHQR